MRRQGRDDHGDAAARAGVGLTSMRERAAELGGTLRVKPAVGSGTIVTASLPVSGG
jgi:signal transduction histidine kinase